MTCKAAAKMDFPKQEGPARFQEGMQGRLESLARLETRSQLRTAGARCGGEGHRPVYLWTVRERNTETLPEPLVKEGLVMPAPLTFA